MKRPAVALSLALLSFFCGGGTLHAQDLVIKNVRVVVGNGTVIERGSITIAGGKITAVSAAASNAANAIDANGMSALPGFIDAHRHVNTGPDEKKEMQALLDAGYTTILSGGGPADGNITLRDHIDSGKIRGPRSPQTMMAAVDAGVKYLVHTPHFGWLPFDDAKREAAAGVKQLSTIGFGVPVFGVFANDNNPRFRDGKPWPESILQGDGRGQEAGYKAVNARTSWDSGVIYGYGTDTNYDPKAGLAHELKTLNLMFSVQDIVKLMGPNTASYIEMSNELGTLEAGKQADIVLVEGNPFDGYWNLLNTRLVLKGGVVVSDQRK